MLYRGAKLRLKFGAIKLLPKIYLLQLCTGAVLSMVDRLSAFDRGSLIVPIWMI